jgi:hypothetical protein
LTLQAALEPGEELEFEYLLDGISHDQVDSLETSVLWYTEGKGGEDFGVHFFQKLSRDELKTLAPDLAHRVSTPLPASPLSYEGKLIKIRWCVRIRLFLQNGKELSAQRAFYLGHLTFEV